jgi:hypothetical protein
MLKLALTFKWLGALLLCLLLAGVFAALAQWQVTRSVIPNSDNESWNKVQVLALDEIAQVGEPYTFNEISKQGKSKVLTEVNAKVILQPSFVLVANRVQLDGCKGYWLVVQSHTNQGILFLAVGFIENEVTARKVLADLRKPSTSVASSHGALDWGTQVQGRYIPSEAPEAQLTADTFSSLSIAQLINLTQDVQSPNSNTYAGALVLTQDNPFSSISNLEPITIGLAKSETQLNWLSAFYAIEWTVFAGFALFIWWRLLSDAYLKQQSKIGK